MKKDWEKYHYDIYIYMCVYVYIIQLHIVFLWLGFVMF